jgi:hypothetical protein
VADDDRGAKTATAQPRSGAAIVGMGLCGELKRTAADVAAAQRRDHVVAAAIEGEARNTIRHQGFRMNRDGPM